MDVQPLLHDLLAAVLAPTQAWSGPDGQIRAVGAQGVHHGDTRVLSTACVRVGGAEPETVAAAPDGPGRVRVVAVTRAVDGPGADPTARLDRVRTVRPGAVDEQLVLSCSTAEPVRARVELLVRADATPMERVKGGRAAVAVDGRDDSTETVGRLGWRSGEDLTATLQAPGARVARDGDPAQAVLWWDVEVTPGAPVSLAWRLDVADAAAVVHAPSRAAPEWSVPQVVADDRRLPALLGQALDDLATLRMSASFAPDDVFLAAGAPWFFTLFGRDSLWAARMLLPLGTDLAAGTLRTLAARQGRVEDAASAEQPGKILHEVRRSELVLPEHGLALPPLYYGTVDATPLWVCLLHDAWRWGMAADEVEALLPAVEGALTWMVEHGDADGDGFLEYVDATGRGLANQGWKDSGDSVQWRDGRLATSPIALVEVQGYAYEAAMSGAAVLEAFGRPGTDRWRSWADRLADRFRASFWVESPAGAYPGIALDADKAVVDTVTSNIGHLLGTGLLSDDEERAVALRLGSPDMDAGRGLRTMSSDSAGYWPMRYHGGAVWPHDTAVVVAGLARGGHTRAAASLVDGLLTAGDDFAFRLPELWSGDARDDVPRTVPYPAACRPQAWSAASAVTVLVSALGLDPDVPGGTLTVRPPAPSPVGAVDVRGLRLAGLPLDVRLAADGTAEVRTAADVRVLTGSRPAG
ncbi:MAG: glycogen debranching N-terminal domain-containing protein [Cellulomonas sp.]